MTDKEYASISAFLGRLQDRVEIAPERLPMKTSEALIAIAWARSRLNDEKDRAQ
jgi:hypothetical protein